MKRQYKDNSLIGYFQEVEGRYNWRGPPYNMIMHTLQTGIVKEIFRTEAELLLYIREIFLIQMKYRLQSMYNHMVGRAASDVSPFYSIILSYITKYLYNSYYKFYFHLNWEKFILEISELKKENLGTEGIEFCHKLCLSNFYIFRTQWRTA